MAAVYRATDPQFPREVAIKVLTGKLVDDADFRARFAREAQSIAALEHPAIVPVYDYGEQDDVPYLVMRLMEGGALAERLQAGPLPLAQAVAIIQQLAGALDAAHAQGLVHRDLKPGNILFDRHDNAYLADFGIVKLTRDDSLALTAVDGILGTPLYMSPEQIRGKETLDGRSDIYSLGIIFFEMLTGSPPFHGDTPIDVAVKHIHEPAPSPMLIRQDLPPACEPIIAKVLAKDRADRYPTAAAFAAAIARLLAEPGAALPPPTPALPNLHDSETELAPVAEWRDALEYPTTPPPLPLVDATRLQPYLPHALLQELDFADPDWAARCFDRLQQLLRTVVTYLPRHLAPPLLANPRPPADQVRGTFLEGTLLFADISGFSKLSEALHTTQGKAGAEELVRIVNAVLDEMLTILFRFDGRLITFGGDAMLSLFTGPQQGAIHAVRAAWAMRRTMRDRFGTVAAFQELHPLRIKVGHSSGLLFAATVGSAQHLEYFLSGSAVEQTARAESAAHAGQIIISAGTYRQIRETLQAEELPHLQGYYRILSAPAEVEAVSETAVPDTWHDIETALTAEPPHRASRRATRRAHPLPAGELAAPARLQRRPGASRRTAPAGDRPLRQFQRDE
jgi:class 3 adenylate cyclase